MLLCLLFKRTSFPMALSNQPQSIGSYLINVNPLNRLAPIILAVSFKGGSDDCRVIEKAIAARHDDNHPVRLGALKPRSPRDFYHRKLSI